MKLFFRQLGAGRPIIVIHGLLGSSDNWMSIGKELADSHAVYLLDLRNHGRSPHSEEFNYTAMTEDVNEFMRDHEIRQAIVLGHSMGGKVAMNLTLLYPQKVEKLVVVDIAPKSYENGFFKNILHSLSSLDLEAINSRREADQLLALHIAEPAVRQFLLKNLARGDHQAFRWKMNLPVIYRSLSAISGGITAGDFWDRPTLFVAGGKSNYVVAQDQELIGRLFPQAKVVSVAGVGHWVHAEAPQRFLEIVRKFIRRD